MPHAFVAFDRFQYFWGFYEFRLRFQSFFSCFIGLAGFCSASKKHSNLFVIGFNIDFSLLQFSLDFAGSNFFQVFSYPFPDHTAENEFP